MAPHGTWRGSEFGTIRRQGFFSRVPGGAVGPECFLFFLMAINDPKQGANKRAPAVALFGGFFPVLPEG